MGIKSKVFGFVAAAALTFSMVGGASAAPGSGSVTGSVTVAEGLCGISMSVSNTNFGTFTWQDTEYVRTAGNNVSILTGTIYPSQPGGVCDVTVTSTGLSNGTSVIPANNFSLNMNGGGFTPWTNGGSSAFGPLTFENVPAGNGSLGVKLDSIPNTFQPGTYNGTLTIGVSNAD